MKTTVESIKSLVDSFVDHCKGLHQPDDAAVEDVKRRHRVIHDEIRDWADVQMAEAKAEGRDQLHADDARKLERFVAQKGRAALAAAEIIAVNGQSKANLARINTDTRAGDRKLFIPSFVPSMSEYERRGQMIGNDPAGGYVVDPTKGPFIDRFRPESVVFTAGPREQVVDSDALEFPLLAASVTAYRVGENAEVTGSQVTLAKARIPMRSYAAYTIGSKEWFEDAAVDARALIADDQAKQIAAKVDLEMLAGSGPVMGLRQSGTATSLAVAGATPTLNNILDAIYRMQANNAQPSAFFMHPRTWNSVRKIVDGQQRYQLAPDPAKSAERRLFDLPVYLSSQIGITEDSDNAANHDCSYIILADMRYVIVGVRQQMSLLIDPYTYSKNRQVAVLTDARFGMGVALTAAVEVLTGVRP